MDTEKIVFSLSSDVCSPSFLATADVHLAKKLYNTPELEEDLKDNLVRLADLAIEKKVNYLVIAGDLFEDNNVKPHMVAFVANIVERLKLHNIKTVGIAGDHDKPLKGEAWIHISGVDPVTVEPAFAGIDYFDYSSVTIDELIGLIKDGRKCENVLWLFLHCQFPQVFNKAEPKKSIDFNQLRLFENFPNLQGVIAGDLHYAPETRAYGVGHEAYVGYPGSLGIGDRSEYKHNKHVLWCDGKHLKHLPFPMVRQMKEIEFRGEAVDSFDIEEHLKWIDQQTVKPIIYLNYDTDSENQMYKVVPLYSKALIKKVQMPLGGAPLDEVNQISCRSEATTEDKIDKALKVSCENDENLYKLASSLLKDDVKDVLDKLRISYNL